MLPSQKPYVKKYRGANKDKEEKDEDEWYFCFWHMSVIITTDTNQVFVQLLLYARNFAKTI